MDLRLSCPLRVATVPWQPEPGKHALCVICKATYRLEPGVARLDPVQLAPAPNDRHWNDAPSRSLYGPSDLAPAKVRADVLLVGRAFSPDSAPVPSIRTRLCVGGIDKRLDVFGARFFTPEGRLVQESKILDLSLWYERAAGGPGTPNPVGVRADARDARGWRVLPSIQPAGWRVARPEDLIPPAGYGPFAPSWPTRQSKLRGDMGAFEPGSWWDEPLPADFDLAYFNVAPEDQQLPELRPDAAIVLENLLSKHARLTTRLPGLRPRAMLKRRRGQREPVGMKADTLWIDSARGICTLTWRGRVDLRQIDEPGRIEISMEQERADGVVLVVADPVEAESDAVGSKRLRAGPGDDPDGGVTEPTFPEMELPSRPAPPRHRRPRPAPEEYTPVATPLPGIINGDPLPFRKSVPPSGEQDPAPRPSVPSTAAERGVVGVSAKDDGSITLDDGGSLPAMLQGDALPFRKSVPPPLPSSPALQPPRRSGAPVPLPFIQPPAAGNALEPDPKPEPNPKPDPKPAANAPAEPKPAAEAEATEPPAAAEQISVEQCGAIAASLAVRPNDSAATLEDNDLEVEPWEAVEAYWAKEIRKEAGLGKTRLLRSYDRSYVERLEEERGPIEVEEYARLVVAAERGRAESVLRDLRLPPGSMVRIERVFLCRVVDRPALGDKVRKAVEAARNK